MFLGNHKSSVDYKGRLYMPVGLGDEMDETLFLKKGQDNRLEIHTIGHIFWRPSDNLVSVKVEGGRRITIPEEFRKLLPLQGEGKVMLECHGSFIKILPRPNGQEERTNS